MSASAPSHADVLIALTLASEVRACRRGDCELCDWARKALKRKGFGYLLDGGEG